MTRTQAIERACNTLDSGVLAADLGRRIAYATESEEADRTASQLRAYLTQELVPCLARLGFGSQVIENPVDARLPLLIAKRVESATAPTLLMYAHGDVVRGHDAQWQEGLKPWVLHEQFEGTTPRWYGRGSADNKGQHSINFAALEQVHSSARRQAWVQRHMVDRDGRRSRLSRAARGLRLAPRHARG